MRALPLVAKVGFLLALLMGFMVGSHFLLGDALQAFLDKSAAQLAGASAAALVLLSLTSDILLPIPSSVISIWAMIALGFSAGVVIVWLGMMSSCVLGYYLGLSANKTFIQRFIKGRDLNAVSELFNRFGTMALVLCRAVPVLAEASVISAGISAMPFKRFVWVSALANAGIALAYGAAVVWAEANASFALAFAASIALPVLAFGVHKLVSTKASAANTEENESAQVITTRFSMEFSYPLVFTRNVFASDNLTLANLIKPSSASLHATKVQFFIDSGVLNSKPELAAQINTYCQQHKLAIQGEINTVVGSDTAKTSAQVETLYQRMLAAGLDRQSYVVAIGGGAVLDVVGFAAATFHRGVRFIRLPTTVLAQNDAGVGVKNGINHCGLKNLVGSFAIPEAVINDSAFLSSLSLRDFRSGFAEAIKVALIRDAEFFHWLETNADAIARCEPGVTDYLIKRCAQLHLNQIGRGGDPFEMGSARPLDYGHWSAHKLEAITAHALTHGEAVAIGMALDTCYACEVGLLTKLEAERILQLLKRVGFSVWAPALTWETATGVSILLTGLEEFRQHLGGALCVTLLRGIGSTVEVNHIDTKTLLRARDKLQFYASHAQPNSINHLNL